MLDLSKINADLKALKDLYLEKGIGMFGPKPSFDSAEQDEATLVFEIMENDREKLKLASLETKI